MSEIDVSAARQKIIEILNALSDEEKKLFSAVMQIERENLHLAKPHVKQELLQQVREYIK